MTPTHSAPPGAPPPASPDRVLAHSAHHEAFLRLTERQRGLDAARALLNAEWRYVGPLLEGRDAPRVLDIACGSGAQAVAWTERGARVVGVDFDRGLLGLARANAEQAGHGAAAAAHWACGDARRLPFADASFDVVYSNSLLEHVPEWEAALSEMARVLAPRGILVLFTTNRHCPIQQEINHFPFYPWLPEALKGPILRWIMAHRRDLVNFTDYPAVNWFTFPVLRRAFAARGLELLDRLDLAPAAGYTGRRARVAAAMRRWPRLKLLYWLGTRSIAAYGRKD